MIDTVLPDMLYEAITADGSLRVTDEQLMGRVCVARLRANRENAKKSTGPRTSEGKQRDSHARASPKG